MTRRLLVVGTGSKHEDGVIVTRANLPLTPFERKSLTTSTPKPTATAEDEMDEDVVIPDEFDPNVPVGQNYVVAVTGFFCKLCHKFYNNETSAKNNHCQSQPHFDKYQKAMITKAYNKRMKEEAMAGENEPESRAINTSQLNGNTDDAKNKSGASKGESVSLSESYLEVNTGAGASKGESVSLSESYLEVNTGAGASKGESVSLSESYLEVSTGEKPSCYETADESENKGDDGDFLSMEDSSQGSDIDQTKTELNDSTLEIGEKVQVARKGNVRETGKAIRGRSSIVKVKQVKKA